MTPKGRKQWKTITQPLPRYIRHRKGVCTKDYFNHMCGTVGYPCFFHEHVDTLWSLQAACV